MRTKTDNPVCFTVCRAMLFLSVVPVLFLFIFSGCGGRSALVEGKPEDQLARAGDLLERGKEVQSLEAYRLVAGKYAGTEFEERARIGIARSYRLMKDHPAAIQEYRNFIRRHPRSEFVDDSAFEIGLCYAAQRKKPSLDQEWNSMAMNEFTEFIAMYPRSDLVEAARAELQQCRSHAAEKEMLNGITYKKLRRYGAARFYFQIVLDEYPETPVVSQTLYEMGDAWEREKDLSRAGECYAELTTRFPDSEWAKKARRSLAKLDDGAKEEGNP